MTCAYYVVLETKICAKPFVKVHLFFLENITYISLSLSLSTFAKQHSVEILCGYELSLNKVMFLSYVLFCILCEYLFDYKI